MTNKTPLFLFLAIATILLASPLASGTAFADDDNHKKDKDKKDKKDKDDKNDSHLFKSIWIAIIGLQAQIDALKSNAGSQGPIGFNGTNGLPGPAGPAGPAGPTTWHISFDGVPITVPLSQTGSDQASCASGNVQVGSLTVDGKLTGIVCQHITVIP